MVWRRTLVEIQSKSITWDSCQLQQSRHYFTIFTNIQQATCILSYLMFNVESVTRRRQHFQEDPSGWAKCITTRIWMPALSVCALSVFARSFANFLKPKASWQWSAPPWGSWLKWNESCGHKISKLGVLLFNFLFFYCFCQLRIRLNS